MTTGKLYSIGNHTTCDNYPQEFHDDLNFAEHVGALVKMTPDAMRQCAPLLYTEVRVVSVDAFDMVEHLTQQHAWAQETFGPGLRTAALSDHIRKELDEVARDPTDVREWLDVAFLAFEGALRTGASPAAVCAALASMLARNKARMWPDWRTAPPDAAIEHVRCSTCDDRRKVEYLHADGIGFGEHPCPACCVEHVLTEDGCAHTDTVRGPNIPLRHGSYRSEMCRCGMWRMTGHSPTTPMGPWRTDSIDDAARLDDEA